MSALPSQIRLLATSPYKTFHCNSGANYAANSEGIIFAVPEDVGDLLKAGCRFADAWGFSDIVLGTLLAANMNVTTDQQITLSGVPDGVGFAVRRITARNATVSLTTAVGGVYSAASKGGTAVVAATQAYSTLTGSTLYLDLTIAAAGKAVWPAATPLYLALTTAQGAAANADILVYGELVY